MAKLWQALAGHLKSARGPHAARGPHVGQHWPKVTSGASAIRYMLYKIQPTGPALRLATQQVGYDQKGKSAVQRRKLQQHSQYHSLDGASFVSI